MINSLFSVAPMMDWTDRHCRYFYRLLSKRAVLYTEMIIADAIIHGHRDHLLEYNADEHPVILQIGASDPYKAGEATKIAEDYGYDEVNLNVGCPSGRVQSGSFGACLMKDMTKVVQIVTAMMQSTNLPVTIKCRIGVDDQNTEETLPDFIRILSDNGIQHFIIHARKAWLEGLSPKDNRNIPPLNYDLVYRMKQLFPNINITINGGIPTIESVNDHLKFVDGVMMGRNIYADPWLLSQVDSMIYGDIKKQITLRSILEEITEYTEKQMEKGQKFHNISRHILGISHNRAGGKKWRRIISMNAHKQDAKPSLFLEALTQSGMQGSL